MIKYSWRSKASESDISSAIGNVAESISYDINSLWIPATSFSTGTWVGHAPATLVNAGFNAQFPAWKLDTGKVEQITAYSRRHRDWRRGVLCIKIHYALGPSASHVAYLTVSVQGINEGSSFTPGTWSYSTATLPEGTSGTSLMVSDVIYGSVMNQYGAAVGVNVYIERTGTNPSDTSLNPLFIYGVELQFVPSSQPVSATRVYRTTGR